MQRAATSRFDQERFTPHQGHPGSSSAGLSTGQAVMMAGSSSWSEVAADLALRLIGASDDDLDRVVNETLEEIATFCDAERGYVTFYDPIEATFDISHEWTRGVVPQRPAIQHVRLDQFPWSVGCADRQEILVVDHIDDLPPEAAAERASFGAFGVRSILQIPIVHNGSTVGIAGLNRFEPNPGWDSDTIEFARRVGQAVGVALARNRALREIASAHERAELARRSRDDLLAHVSHELRTPLHAILGYAELLELDERSDHDRDALMRIQTNGRHLLAMIDDLSELARSGPAVVHRTDVGAVTDEIITDLAHVAGDRGLELVGGACAGVAGVEIGRFRQVARCLVIGAAQSMRDGRIVIEADGGDDETVLRLRLASTRAIARDGLVLPMAQMLMLDHGRIETRAPDDRHTVTVSVTFDTR